jgi:uroporphyrinogen III methyltransferase / synthase
MAFSTMSAAQTSPLRGKRVLVTRARAQASSTVDLLRERGAEPVIVPTIEIHPAPDPEALAAAVKRLREGGYEWLLVTSANGVDAVASADSFAAAGAGRAIRIGAVGTATARALERHGLTAEVVAKSFRGEGLAEALLSANPGARPKALLARAAKARDALPDALRAAGWELDVVAAYETRSPAPEVAARLVGDLGARRIDAVLLTSSSTVDNLCDLLGPAAGSLLAGTRVASIGPLTTATAEARGVRVDVTATPSTVEALVRALEETWPGEVG